MLAAIRAAFATADGEPLQPARLVDGHETGPRKRFLVQAITEGLMDRENVKSKYPQCPIELDSTPDAGPGLRIEERSYFRGLSTFGRACYGEALYLSHGWHVDSGYQIQKRSLADFSLVWNGWLQLVSREAAKQFSNASLRAIEEHGDRLTVTLQSRDRTWTLEARVADGAIN